MGLKYKIVILWFVIMVVLSLPFLVPLYFFNGYYDDCIDIGDGPFYCLAKVIQWLH